jgi:molybdopterin-binding protein
VRTAVPKALLFRKCGDRVKVVTNYRISEAAALLGVSDDTVRRWVSDGILNVTKNSAGRQVVDGSELAAHAQRIAVAADDTSGVQRSARNHLVGLVTGIVMDTVMAQVELQCGPHRVVSLMSSEAVRDLGLEVGSRAVAVIKATMVIVETERETERETARETDRATEKGRST